jgi:dTDP-glucose 4,6-dehydratase
MADPGPGGRDSAARQAMSGRLQLDGSRVLVTGGAGFIGSNFVHYFLERHPASHVVVLDALTYAGRRENLDGVPARSLTFVHGDIRDAEAVARAMDGCDLVLNFAAESHVDRSIETPGEFIQTDVFGVFVLCEEARRRRVRRFIQISTDEVYGEVLEGHSTEEWPLMPRSPYAASKAGGDRLAYAYHATYGLPVVVTRCSNNYGPRQYPEKLVPLFITNAIEDQPLPVYGNGLNRRDWLHVEDHCAALLALLEHPGIEGETFNIGAQHELDVLTITAAILRLLDKPETLIRHVEDRPGHDRRYAVDSSKLTRRVGWRPSIDFEDGITRTVRWFEAHPEWWRPIKQGEFRAYYERMYGRRKILKEVKA